MRNRESIATGSEERECLFSLWLIYRLIFGSLRMESMYKSAYGNFAIFGVCIMVSGRRYSKRSISALPLNGNGLFGVFCRSHRRYLCALAERRDERRSFPCRVELPQLIIVIKFRRVNIEITARAHV